MAAPLLAAGERAFDRSYKFRHLLDEALALEPGPLAVLAVLMLRGAQTPGELKQRTDRMEGFPDLAAVQAVLDDLIEREYVARIERRPGQKEERYRHRLSDDAADGPPPEPAATVGAHGAAPGSRARGDGAARPARGRARGAARGGRAAARALGG